MADGKLPVPWEASLGYGQNLPGKTLPECPLKHVGVLHAVRAPQEQEEGKVHRKQEEKPLPPAHLPTDKVPSSQAKGSVGLRGIHPLATVPKRLIVKLALDNL